MPGKSSSLDGREPLADGVDLHDVRAAAQELIGDILQFFPRHQRLFEQRTAAAGQQKQHRILCLQIRRQIQRLLGPGKGILIGNGVPRLA